MHTDTYRIVAWKADLPAVLVITVPHEDGQCEDYRPYAEIIDDDVAAKIIP